MAVTALTHKSWTDLSRRPARAVLTTLTLALAVASFGILAIPSLMNKAMNAEVAKARMNNLSASIGDVALSPAQIQALAKLPNVTAVSARSLFATRALIGGRWVDTEVWGVPDFANQPLDRVLTTSRPGPGQVLVDLQDAALGISNATTGDTLRLQAADGSLRTVTVAGSGRALALNQDTRTDVLVLYATQPTVQALGGFTGVNILEFGLRDTRQPAADATIAAVRAFLARQPNPTTFSSLPTVRSPGNWPYKDTFDQRVKIIDILVVLAVISAAFLLANTIRTMVSEQSREIGVMRAVGARRRDVRRGYLVTVALLGLGGAILGAALGIVLSNLLVAVFGRMIFGVSPAFAIDWPVVVLSALVGEAGAVLMAWPMLRRALRTPVRDALESEGLVSTFGGSRLDRAVLHSGALSPPLRIGLRNVARQKGRSVTTIVQIALAVATLLGLLSLTLAVAEVTDQSWNVLDFDIYLSAQPGGRLYSPAVVDQIRAQPGVSGVEAADWSQMTYRGQTLDGIGIPATTFIREPLTAGRWLTATDERTAAGVAVIGSAAARRWHLHPRSVVTLTTAGGPATFAVVGVGGSDADNGLNIYLPLATLQRATGHPAVTNSLLVRATNKNHAAIDTLATRLEDTLAHTGYPSQSQIMYAGRANDQASARTTLRIVQGIGLLIVAISMLGLVNAITMSIIERTREIGVLRCLGARARDLRRMFRAETLALSLFGFVLAIPLGWAIAHALQLLILHLVDEQLPAPYTLVNLALALVGTIVLAVVVVAAPLRRATRLRPGEAIRYN